MPSTIPILSPAESAAWDARAEREGMALETLMEGAGRGSAAGLLDRFGHAARKGGLVAAGPGHNGGGRGGAPPGAPPPPAPGRGSPGPPPPPRPPTGGRRGRRPP